MARVYLQFVGLLLMTQFLLSCIVKPHMTPRTIQRGLRRSKRTRLPPLRHYAGERPVYQFDKITGEFNVCSINVMQDFLVGC